MSRTESDRFRIALKAIATYSTDPQARELASFALEEPAAPPSSPRLEKAPLPRPKTAAERAADYRARRDVRHEARHDGVTENVTAVTSRHVTRHGLPSPSLVLSPSPLTENSNKKPSSRPDSPSADANKSVTSVTNVTSRDAQKVTSRHASSSRDGEPVRLSGGDVTSSQESRDEKGVAQ